MINHITYGLLKVTSWHALWDLYLWQSNNFGKSLGDVFSKSDTFSVLNTRYTIK